MTGERCFVLSVQLHPNIGQIFAKQWQVRIQQETSYFEAQTRQLREGDYRQAIQLMDEEWGNLSDLLNRVLQEDSVQSALFPDLSKLLKHSNRYMNLRHYYTQQVMWSESLLRHILETEQDVDVAVLNMWALAQRALGQHTEAIAFYEDVLRLLDDQNHHPGMSVIYYNMSLTHEKLQQYDEAIVYCERAIEIDRQYQNQQGLVLAHIQLADLKYAMGEWIQAILILEQTLNVLEPLNDDVLTARWMESMAFKRAEIMGAEQAVALFQKTVALWRQIGDEIEFARMNFNYAGLLYEMGQIEQALTLGQDSLRLMEKYHTTYVEKMRQTLAFWQENTP